MEKYFEAEMTQLPVPGNLNGVKVMESRPVLCPGHSRQIGS